MAAYDERISSLAETVLKRPLDDGELAEIYRISDAVGMKDVHSFLHLILVFKLHEDTMKRQFGKLDELEVRLNEKFGEMGELEKKINGTLESSVEKVLGEGAGRIGADMGAAIADGAKETLAAVSGYHCLRGQVILVCFVCVVSTLAYWLGSWDILGAVSRGGTLEALLFLPAGWSVFFCGAVYAFLWAGDNWDRVKETALYKIFLGLQVFLLSALALALL
ncbi:MAG: hypothetical protein LBS53_00500 [Synergistaceae bacterium]|jgi:hypothetical protein|nr:hypothetical protein [Synergistaceae bacterium]